MPSLAALPSSPATVAPAGVVAPAAPGAEPGSGLDLATAPGFAGLLIAPVLAGTLLPGATVLGDVAAPGSALPATTELPCLVVKPAAAVEDPELLALLAAIAGQCPPVLPEAAGLDASGGGSAGPAAAPGTLVPTLAALLADLTPPAGASALPAPTLPGAESTPLVATPVLTAAAPTVPTTAATSAPAEALPSAVAPAAPPVVASAAPAVAAGMVVSATPDLATATASVQTRAKTAAPRQQDFPAEPLPLVSGADAAELGLAEALAPPAAVPDPGAALPTTLAKPDPAAGFAPMVEAAAANDAPSVAASPGPPTLSPASAAPAPQASAPVPTPVAGGTRPEAADPSLAVATTGSAEDKPVESARPVAEPVAPAAVAGAERPATLQPAQRSEVTTGQVARPPNPVERVVASQVARAVIQHLPDGGERLTLRLTPPELGTVRVEFLSRDGVMTARLIAEDDGVRQALERALPQLRSELKGDHPQLDIHVDKGDQRWAWNEQQRGDQRGGDHGTGPRRRRDDEPAFSLDGLFEPVATTTAQRAEPILGGRVTRTLVDALA